MSKRQTTPVKSKARLKLDAEEQALLKSIDMGEWRTARSVAKEKKEAVHAAGRFTRKDARINIRISSFDLDRMKQIAAHEGLSYQTLIASVIHKYAAAR